MQLDNATRASKIRIIYMAIPSLVIIITALIYLLSDTKDFGLAIMMGGVLVVFLIVMAILRFYYISIYIAPDKIRLRYKSLSPLPSEKNSILIKTEDFYNYKIKESFFGIKKSLVLSMKTPGGIANFSKVSLLSLSQAEINKITKALDILKIMNEKN